MRLKESKASIYILLMLVIGIWVSIGWKVATGIQTKGYEVVPKSLPIVITQRDTFRLSLAYDDPFKVKHVANNTPKKKSSPKVKKKRIYKKVDVKWPQIDYQGQLNNVSKGSRTAMIRISGKQFMVDEGSSEMEVQVLTCHKDSVEVSYKGHKKVIKK